MVHFEKGPGASDKVSDNGSRHRQTQRDLPRHRYQGDSKIADGSRMVTMGNRMAGGPTRGGMHCSMN